MDDITVCGYYGKLPGNGDFVSRHLPPSFIEAWDRWLQDSLGHARTLLGDAWPEAYLTGPIWRFALSKETCSDAAWVGLIMPSVDKVGRHFPLTIAMALPAPDNLLHVVTDSDAWFDEIESLALTAIDENFQREAFDQVIDALAPPVAVSGRDVAAEPGLDTARRYEINSRDDIGLILNAWAQRLLHTRIGPHSLWWSDGSDRLEPSLLISPGLPTPQRFAAMLDGNWDLHDWNTGSEKTDE